MHMNRSQKILLVTAIVLLVAASGGLVYARHEQKVRMAVAAAASPARSSPLYSHSLTIGGVPVQVAFAKTEAEREQGLSDTQPLADNQGMLFFYDTPVIPYFWMKDMRYDLDMIWIEDGTVADISADAKVSDFPKTYNPKVPVSYVLEVNAGFAALHGIVIGSPVDIEN